MSKIDNTNAGAPVDHERLIQEHGELVRQIVYRVKKKLPPSVQTDDLYQAGIIGLMHAAENFNAGRGANFNTYAGIRIHGAVMDEVRTSDWTPRSISRHIREIAAARQRIEARTGKRATERAIASEIGVTLTEYHRIVRLAADSRLISTEEHTDDNGASLLDAPSPDKGPQEHLQCATRLKRVSEAIKRLPEKERLVLSLYYDEEMNLKEIAKIMGVSESRVSQLHVKAIERLRKQHAIREA